MTKLELENKLKEIKVSSLEIIVAYNDIITVIEGIPEEIFAYPELIKEFSTWRANFLKNVPNGIYPEINELL